MTRRFSTLVAPVLLAGAGLYVLIWILFAPRPVYAADHTVGGACGSTIQACIDAAAPGDTVIVPTGIWTESLTLGKAVSLTGVSSATAIIQADAGQRVLTVTGATIDHRVIISGLTFTGGDVISGNICNTTDVTNCGGGIVLTDGAQPLIQHAIIEQNAAHRGGGLHANVTSTLHLDHVVFRHNLSTLSGAGLSASNLPLTVTNSLFQENTTTHNVGGALRASANFGVAAPVWISNTRFISNTALCTGSIPICHGSGVYLFDQDTQIYNSLFQGNRCHGDSCDGGGLYTSSSFNRPSLHLVNSDFVSNTAGRAGGGLSVNGLWVQLNVTGGRFERNHALRHNGGGLTSFALHTTLHGVHFISNSAAAITGSFLVGGGGAYIGLTVTVTSAIFAGNQSGLHGGGLALRVTPFGTIISDTTFLSNTAAQSGGGLSVGIQDGFSGNRSATIVNSYFEGNTSNALDDNNALATRAGGGGAWVGGTTLITASEFLSNSSQTIGGGLYGNSDVRLVDTHFQGNQALAKLFPFSRGGGGLSSFGAVIFEEVHFHDNYAQSVGGGLLAIQSITGTGGLFHNNRTGGSGGGLFANGGLAISGTHFISNYAGFGGGGAFVDEGADVQHVLLQSNQAGTGGGLRLSEASVLDNVHVVANQAVTFGGGGVAIFAPVTVTNSLFERNQSATSGGGLRGSFDQVTLVDSQFLSNSATTNGGALSANGTISVSQTLIQANSADNNGGGLYTSGRVVLVGDGWSLVENSAAVDGGGVWANSGLQAEDGRFEQNQSGNDGGGYYGGLALLFVYGTHFIDNHAGGDGGGAYSFDGREVTGAIFEDNYAGGLGGGLFLHRFARITATHFVSNVASLGGGLAISRTNAGTTPQRMVNSLLERNTATVAGAGLYYNQPRPFAIRHNSFVHPALSPGAAVVVVTGTVGITGNIFASHTIGILQAGDAALREEYNLFHRNTTAISGSVSSGLHSFDGDPRFVDADAGNYRLALGSDAVDARLCGLNADLDGQPRPGAATDFCDTGAYETQGVPDRCYATPDDGTTTLYASTNAAAVQAAIDDLEGSGGTVRIAGICAGVRVRDGITQTVYISAPVTLRGGYTTTNWTTADPLDNPTVLDAQSAGRVIYATHALTLENLRLQNGWTANNGGGVYANAALTMTTSSVVSNSAAGIGGGMVVTGRLYLSGTEVLGNRAGEDGGGIYAVGGGSLFNSRLANNRSMDGRGGGLFLAANLLRLANSLLVSNTAQHGGGLYVDVGALHLLNSTLAANHAIDSGGGLSATGDLTITNSILWHNTPNQVGTTASVTRSLIEDDELGGIDADPRFVRDPERTAGDLGDLHLRQDSPAIDAGEDALAAGLTIDLDGLPRFFDVTAIANKGANVVDMGAYEFNSQAQLPTADAGGPYTGVEGSSIALDGSGSTALFGLVGYGWDCTTDGALDAVSPLPTGDSCPYPDSGSFSVRLLVTDTGGLTATDSAAVTVNNIAPVVTTAAQQTATEGISGTFGLGSFSDPGADDPWNGNVDWGDGSANTLFSVAVAGALPDQTHTYALSGTYIVTVTVDDGQESGRDAFQVTVFGVAENRPPSFTSSPLLSATVGVTYTYHITATDPDAGDVLTITAPTQPAWLAYATIGNGTAELTASPDAADVGQHLVVLRVEDQEGAADTQTFTLTVSAAPTRTGTVSGTVVDAGGEGIAGAQVTLTDEAGVLQAAMVRTQSTGATGAYRFDSVPTGVYSLTVAAAGYRASAPVTVTVAADATTAVDPIVLQKEYTDNLYLPWLQRNGEPVHSGRTEERPRLFLPALWR